MQFRMPQVSLLDFAFNMQMRSFAYAPIQRDMIQRE